MPFFEFSNKFVNLLDEDLPVIIPRIITTAFFITFLFIFRKVSLQFIRPRITDHISFLKWKKSFSVISVLLLIIFILPMWMPSLNSFSTFIGIFGAGTIIVFKDIFVSIAGWVYIVMRKPFEAGNRVSIADVHGDVLDIRILEFTLIEVNIEHGEYRSSGRIIHIPNHRIFTMPLKNSSKEFAFNWNEISLELTKDSDWQKAIKLIEKQADKVIVTISDKDARIVESTEKYFVTYKQLNPRVYVRVESSKIILTLRYLCQPLSVADTNDKLWRNILIEMQKHKREIKLA